MTWFAYGLQACYAYLLNGLGPSMPSLRRELGLSYTVASLHFSAFAVGMIGAGLVGERVVARLGRPQAARLALAGMVCGLLLLVFGRHPAVTLLGVLTMSGLGSLLLVVITASLSDAHPGQRGVAITEANVAASLASTAGPLLIGVFEGLGWGWRPALGAVLLGVVPLGLARSRVPAAVPVPSGARFGRLPTAYWAGWLTIVCVVSIEFCLIYWAADFLQVDAGLSAADAAASVSVFLLAMLLGRIAGSRLAERVSGERLLVGSLVVTAVGFGLYWAMLPVVLRLAGLFVAGLGIAQLYPMTLSLAMAAAPLRADAAAARSSLASGAAILIAPLILGGLADQAGIRAAHGIVVVLLIAAYLVSRLASRLA